MLIVALVFLNLFVAVVLQGFAESEHIEYGRLTGQHYDEFRQAWSKFDSQGKGFLKLLDLPSLLRQIGPPCGTKGLSFEEHRKITNKIQHSGLALYENHYHFFEVANALAIHLFK